MALSATAIQNELLHGACADSIHDFGISKEKATKKGVPTLGDVLITLPGNHSIISKKDVRDEAAMLNTLLKMGGGNPVENLVDELSKVGFQKVFDINGLTTNTYTVKLLHDSAGKFNIRNIRKTVTTDEYKTFFNISGADPLNLVIDAQTVTMNKLFGDAVFGKTGKIMVNNILNREIVNDPAPKTHDVNVFKNDGSAIYKIKYDEDPRIITYSSFNDDMMELNRNKFFSTLELCISPLNSTTPNSLPKVNLDIINQKKNIVYQTNDPHKTNSIAVCLDFINKLLGTTGDKHIKCSALFQCKRSGDWLQALSCFDSGRKYSDGGIQGKLKLVTHDRILLWYALFMGIDVIFTGSIPGTDIEASKKDDDDDDDDEEGDPENKKRQKIMLYFGANAESPEARHKRYIDLTDYYNGKNDEFRTKQLEYNKWIQEIINEIMSAIDTKKNAALASIREKGAIDLKGINENTKNVIQLFWYLTAIHYVEYEIPDLMDSNEPLSKLEEFVSKCVTIASIQATIKSKSDLIYKSKAYEVNDEYLKMADMFVDYTRGSRGADSNEVKTMKLCNYLQMRLPNAYIEKLSGILREISAKFESIRPRDYKATFIINYVVNIFKRENYDKLSPIIVEYLKTGAREKVPDGVNLESRADGAQGDDDEAVTVESGSGNRHRAFTVSNVDVAEYGSKYADLIEKNINPDLQTGGGKGDSYMLYMCYLYTLMTAIGGFDDGDSTDYMYYDALGRLVCASINPPNYNYDSLLLLPYYVLPGDDWDLEGVLIKNKGFRDCVRIVSHNIALQSVNMRTGHIPYTNRNNSMNPMETAQYKDKFLDFTRSLNKLSFKSRQRHLLNKLSDIIQILIVPQDGITQFTGIAMSTGIPIKEAITRKRPRAVLGLSGGKKKFKGSPRRKTLRKTRRHR